MAAVETVEGTLHRVRFQGDNGFIIGVFDTDRIQQITALGNLLKPQEGKNYKLHGKWTDNAQWGRQFRFQAYESTTPKSIDGILLYIVHTAKWVGPAVGKQLVERYGIKTLEILKEDPERVAREIRGITIKRALEIQEKMLDNESTENVVVQLEAILGGMGLRKSLPVEIATKWGSDAVDMIKDDPYVICKMKNVGFITADRIALERLKIERNSPKRKVAGTIHVISENEKSGNVWIDIDSLHRATHTLLGCDATDTISHLIKEKEITLEAGYVASNKASDDELYISRRILSMVQVEAI